LHETFPGRYRRPDRALGRLNCHEVREPLPSELLLLEMDSLMLLLEMELLMLLLETDLLMLLLEMDLLMLLLEMVLLMLLLETDLLMLLLEMDLLILLLETELRKRLRFQQKLFRGILHVRTTQPRLLTPRLLSGLQASVFWGINAFVRSKAAK